MDLSFHRDSDSSLLLHVNIDLLPFDIQAPSKINVSVHSQENLDVLRLNCVLEDTFDDFPLPSDDVVDF